MPFKKIALCVASTLSHAYNSVLKEQSFFHIGSLKCTVCGLSAQRPLSKYPVFDRDNSVLVRG